MAKLYGEIAAKSLLTLDKSFARANGQPLDASEVYYSYSAAKTYAEGAQAYVGQKIVVVENNIVTHYSIEDAAGTLKELGSTLVGDQKSIVVSADGTISLKGIDTLVFERDILDEETQKPTGNKESVQYQPLMTEDGLIWVEPSKTTVEGLATLLEALTTRVDTAEDDIDALQKAVGNAAKPESSDGAGDGVAATGLFKAIADEIVRATTAEEALGGRIDAIDFVDNDELAEAIKDFATKDHVAEEIGKIEHPVLGVAADDKVLALGADKLISAAVALSYDSEAKSIKLTGKDGVDLGSVDATPFIKDGMLNNVEYDADSNTLTFTWNTDAGVTEDTVVLSDIIEAYTAGNGLELNNNEFSIKVAEDSESFLTVDENGVKLAGVQSAINTAKSEAISDAESKIATAKQEATTAAANDATTKASTAEQNAKTYADDTFATKAYVGTIPNDDEGNPKASNVVAYIEAKAAEVLSQATGGSSESAASVKGQLDTFKAEINPKVAKNTTDITTINEKLATIDEDADVNVIEVVKVNGNAVEVDENKAVDITVPEKFSDITDDSGFSDRITAAQNKADQADQAASNAQSTANEAKEAAADNETAINNLTNTVSGHATSISEHTTKIGALENFQNAHTANYNTLLEIVTGHTTSITGKAEQTALNAAVENISKNTSAIESINTVTIPNLNTEVAKKANAANVFTKTEVTNITGTPTEGKTLVQMIEAAQTAATYDDTSIKADIKKNTDAIEILNGADTLEGSIDYKVAQEVAKIVNENHDGSINTLNEIAAWIVSDNTGAAKMNADIADNTAAITKLNGSADTDGSVRNIVNSAITANAPSIATDTILGLVLSSTAENAVSVASDGKMSVNSLNVNKLVQTTGDTLLLNGGDAEVAAN